MVGHLILSLYSYSQASLRTKRLTAYLPISARRYNQQGKKESNNIGRGFDQERAPSTAEEFKRVAEEKSRQGLASQTVEKAEDAGEEATTGDSNFESVKEASEEPPGNMTGDQR